MKQCILNLLDHAPGCTPATIASWFNLKPASVRKALTILRRQNKVQRAADGTYSLLRQSAPAPQPANS